MANEQEKNVTETETENEPSRLGTMEDTESDYEEEDRVEGKGVVLALHAKRYQSSDGKTYSMYFVPFEVFGKVMELELRPVDGDINGYRLLAGIFEAVYAETHKSIYELTCYRKSSKNEKTGKRMLYMAYEVRYKLPSGVTIAVTLKPYGNSNKRMLEEMYNQKVAF